MRIIKPPKLEKGDCIAVISPSSGLADIFPHRLNNGIKFLESQGYSILEFPTTRTRNGWESASAEERAKDIMDAFTNTDIKAIICSIGGETANKTLEYLDYDLIRKNPKIFCGYSDASVLHYAIYTKSKLVTFYGPCVMTQFAEFPKPLDYTTGYFLKAITGEVIGEIRPSKKWTNEVLDWSRKLDLTRARKLVANSGSEWLKSGKAEGEITGGCLPSITHLLGTPFWPSHKDKILFLELPPGQNVGEGIVLSQVDALLCDLRLTGVLGEIKGLIFGRPYGFTSENVVRLKSLILEHLRDYNVPILYGADIGHTDPQITIPLGTRVKIDSEASTFTFLETGVDD